MKRIAVLAAILLMSFRTVASADELTALDLAALAAAQVEHSEAIWVEGRAFVEVFLEEEEGVERREWFQIFDGQVAFRADGRWCVHGLRFTSEDGSVERSGSEPQHIVHDGERTYLVNKRRDWGVVRAHYGDVAAGYGLRSGIGQGLKRAAVVYSLHHLLLEALRMERIEDDDQERPRLVLHIPPGHPRIRNNNLGIRLTITVDPDAGYMPVEIEYYDIYLGIVTSRVTMDDHVLVDDVWFPRTIVRESWQTDDPEPGTAEYDDLVRTVLRFGVDLEEDRMRDGEWVPYSRDELLAARRGFDAYYGQAGVPRVRDRASKFEVTKVLGVNEQVPDSLFGVPFVEGALVYIDTDSRYYRYERGRYVPTSTPDAKDDE